jgi:hypothetical protein
MDLGETGWIGPRIGAGGKFLLTRQYTFGFQKMFGISSLAALVASAPGGLSIQFGFLCICF